MSNDLTPLARELWPSPDREMWIAATRPGDPFDKPGAAANWRPDTRRLTENGYGTYLRWLSLRGLLEEDVRPIDRVDEERMRAFIEDYSQGRAPSTVALAVRGIAYVLRATDPPHGLPILTKAAHAMANRAEPVTPKTPRMATMSELLTLGAKLMKTGEEALDRGHRSGAQVFRDGLMICALSTRPLRRRNFAGLEIGKTLFVRNDAVHVAFGGDETKSGNPIAFHYPNFLNAQFGTYLNRARPVLLPAAQDLDGGMLWIGRRGRPMCGEEIGQRIGKVTTIHLDRRISPHLFRDCVATEIANHDPEHVGIIKSILGHTRLATSEKYYNQAGSLHAARRLSDVIDRLRDG